VINSSNLPMVLNSLKNNSAVNTRNETANSDRSAKSLEKSFNMMVDCKYYDSKFNKNMSEAAKAKSKGKLDDAINLYSGVYNKNNKELRAITGLADCYNRKGLYNESLKYINEANKLAPNLDNVKRIERDAYFSEKAVSNPLIGVYSKKSYKDFTIDAAKNMVEKTSSALKVALTGVPVCFGKTDPEALAESDGFAITLNEKELGTAAPQVIAAIIAHEAVHSGDRDNKSKRSDTNSISEETDAFEEGAKVWIANRDDLSELGEDNAASKYLKGRETLKNYIKDLYKENHAAANEYSPGHYEEIKNHESGAVTCRNYNGFVAV